MRSNTWFLVQGCTNILDGSMPSKMKAIRKSDFSDCDVEKTSDGLFNGKQ